MGRKSREANRSLNSIVSMRPADGKHVEWIDDEAVVLDPSTEELHYLNGPAALVYALILEHGFDRGLEEVRSIYGADSEIEEGIAECLEGLADKGLLVDG
jgi:hypothetical protein